MHNKIYSEEEIKEAQRFEEEEREFLKKMQEESVRKFKEKFPHGAVIVEGEFLE